MRDRSSPCDLRLSDGGNFLVLDLGLRGDDAGKESIGSAEFWQVLARFTPVQLPHELIEHLAPHRLRVSVNPFTLPFVQAGQNQSPALADMIARIPDGLVRQPGLGL